MPDKSQAYWGALSIALGGSLWLGMLTNVLGLALARDGLAGVVLILGFKWAVVLGLLLVRRVAL